MGAAETLLVLLFPIVAFILLVYTALTSATPPSDSTPLPSTQLGFYERDGSVQLVSAGLPRLRWRSIEMGRSRALVDGREVPLTGYRLSRITHGANASHHRFTLSAVRHDGTLRPLVRIMSSSQDSFEGLRAAMVRQGLIRDRDAQQGSAVDIPIALRTITRKN